MRPKPTNKTAMRWVIFVLVCLLCLGLGAFSGRHFWVPRTYKTAWEDGVQDGWMAGMQGGAIPDWDNKGE